MLNKEETYIVSPSGEMTLVEIFSEEGLVSIIFGDQIRIDLDPSSALDLADAILMTMSNLELKLD